MTREEAIDLLDNLIGMVEDNHSYDYDTALQMGIKALEQEPCRDMEEIVEVINCDADAETKCKMISNILIAKPHYFEEQEPAYCDRNICLRNEYNGIGCDECEVTKSREPKAEKVIKMRDATPEEQEAIDRYIKSISKPTGINVFDFYEDEEKSFNNCKHHLKFMCKKWETCHDYSDWELEELDFVQPHKTIPCKIKVADGEYISRQAVLDITWEEPSYTDALNVLTEVRDKIKALPSVKQEPQEGANE